MKKEEKKSLYKKFLIKLLLDSTGYCSRSIIYFWPKMASYCGQRWHLIVATEEIRAHHVNRPATVQYNSTEPVSLDLIH